MESEFEVWISLLDLCNPVSKIDPRSGRKNWFFFFLSESTKMFAPKLGKHPSEVFEEIVNEELELEIGTI